MCIRDSFFLSMCLTVCLLVKHRAEEDADYREMDEAAQKLARLKMRQELTVFDITNNEAIREVAKEMAPKLRVLAASVTVQQFIVEAGRFAAAIGNEKRSRAIALFRNSRLCGGGYGRRYSALRAQIAGFKDCLLYTSPSPRDKRQSRMPSSA